MKKFLLVLTVFFLAATFDSCNKTTEATVNCTNNIKDNDETEIDCGGSCSPCPEAATMTCTLGGNFSFVSDAGSTSGVFLSPLSPSLRINSYSVASGYLKF